MSDDPKQDAPPDVVVRRTPRGTVRSVSVPIIGLMPAEPWKPTIGEMPAFASVALPRRQDVVMKQLLEGRWQLQDRDAELLHAEPHPTREAAEADAQALAVSRGGVVWVWTERPSPRFKRLLPIGDTP